MQLRSIYVSASLAVLAAACAPKSAQELGHDLVVHGVVTDAATAAVLQGVKVTLLSVDNQASTTTDDRGYFRFSNVLQQDNLLVQYQKDGYAMVTQAVNPTTSATAGCVDGGPCGTSAFALDGLDASVALLQTLSLSVSGWVHAGADLAKGAQVILADVSHGDARIAYQAKAGDDGHFAFASVRPSSYELWVLPWDKDGDGITEYQLYKRALGPVLSTTANLTNLVVELLDVRRDLEASSFVSLSTAYPVAIGALQAGVTGVLQSAGPFYLHFGAEVDPALTQIDLVKIEQGGVVGAPIALQAAWDHAVILTLTPPDGALTATPTDAVAYQLRIKALRFRDGTVAIAPDDKPGTITFTIGTLPTALPNPAPAFYVGGQTNGAQTATQALVDARTIWLLDANGDFVFDTDASKNWSGSNPPLLQWQHVPGAVRYHVWARNTTSAGNNTDAALQWRLVTDVSAPDAALNPTVVASVNLFATSVDLGYSGSPWLFGNGVDLAVTSEDANGFASPVDPSKALSTKDVFGGLLTGVAQDSALSAVPPFGATTERGASFVKSVRLDFSEPMSALSVPALTSGSANLTVVRTNAVGWANGSAPTAASALALNAASSAFVNLSLSIKGACTELMADRAAGDVLLPVRDSSLFAAGATARVLLLNSANGAFLGEAINVVGVDAGLLTLGAPLAQGVAAPRGSLACALDGAGKVAHASSVSNASANVVVDDASLFTVGESVLVYEPQGAAAPVADLRALAGLDTTTNTLVLNAVPSAGHTAATVVLPMNVLGGEYALRGSVALGLGKDVAGGANVDVTLSAAQPLMVGDTVLLDLDGDLRTTVDQVQVKVKAIKMAAAPFSFTADVPPAMTLLHGRAKAIALGDSLNLAGVHDSSSTERATHNLDPHRDQFTADNVLY